MISFIIPAHNEEGIIVETLSRLRKDARDIPHEIILSDDGSTDRTAERAEAHVDTLVRYAGEIPKTIAAARNRGAAQAHYPLLVFLDSDVRIREPEIFLRRIVDHFTTDSSLVAMTVSMRVYPERETTMDKIVLAGFDAYFRLANNVFHLGLTHGKCMIVQATAFKRVGGFNEHIIASEDTELFLRLSRIGKTVLDPSLRIYFSGRRAHATGWAALLWLWALNGLWVVLFRRAYSRHWSRARPL
jgi:glycosyltransferase involved in cell wall biosynthesis